jgi:cellulose synthase/poly-beta-1,6-N-acetylglucosamine synthase-like glycosyltransferase
VFSDANSIYEEDALQRLTQNFNDPEVGYVTGKMIYTVRDGNGMGDGCSAYMRYENFLRQLETNIGSIVGVDGGIDAVRKELYRPMRPDQLPDFVLPLQVLEQGYRVVYEPDAILYEPSLEASGDEYKMRVRVSLRSLWALKDMRRLLSPSKFRMIAWQLWSHKVLRYFSFAFLIGAYLANMVLWPVDRYYQFFFILQNLLYLAAILLPILQRIWRPFRILYFLNYFTLLNLAACHAFLRFLMGQKQVIWTPRKG